MIKSQNDTVQISESFKLIHNKILNNSFESADMTKFLQKYEYIYTKYIGSINI